MLKVVCKRKNNKKKKNDDDNEEKECWEKVNDPFISLYIHISLLDMTWILKWKWQTM